MALLSLCAYARHRGVSKQAVSTAVKQGRVSTVTDPADGSRKIDTETADKEWAVNTNDSRRPLAERVANADRNGQSLNKKRTVGGKDTTAKTVQEYADARAEREGYQARLVRLDLGKKSGELVSAKAVENEAFRVGRTIRDNLFNIPERVSHLLAAESDPAKCHEILRAEIQQVLEALSSTPDEGKTQEEQEEPEPAPRKIQSGASHASP